MAAQLDVADRNRLIQLLGMTGSDSDGEATNAARLADRLVRSKGLRWGDVILPALSSPQTHRPHLDPWLDVLHDWPERWREAVRLCQGSTAPLPDKSRDFLGQISRYANRPSEAQLAWLNSVVEKCRAGYG